MPLRIHLEHDDVTWSVETRHAFDRAVERLRERLSRYALQADCLTAVFEPLDDGRVRARLELNVTDDAQTAMVVEPNARKAVQSSFDTLFRRFDAYAFGLDPARWRPLTRQVLDAEQEPLVRYRQELLRYALPALHRVARHEIERLRDEELLPEDWLDPAEVVDSAIADELPSVDGSQPLPKATLDLIRAVREELLARMTELHEQQTSDTSLETPMQPSLVLGEDEEVDWPLDTVDLSLSDVLGDPELLSPEDVVAEREQREQLVQALFELTDPWRPLFAQVVIDGWTEDVVAAAWNTSVDEVRRAVRIASDRLAAILGDIPSRQIVQIYRALGERLQEERRTRDRDLATTR